MTAITLAQATTIVEATLAKGRELRLDPLTAVVLDPGGHVVALKREDGSGILRPQIATGKAWGGSPLGRSSGCGGVQARTAGLSTSSHHWRKLVGVADCGVRGSALSKPWFLAINMSTVP